MTTSLLAAASSWVSRVAEDATDSKTGSIGPGLTAFLIVAALGVATFLLVRSMLTQINKVPPTFDEPSADEADSGSADPADPDVEG